MYDFDTRPGSSGTLVVNGNTHAYMKLSDGSMHAIPDAKAFGSRAATPIKVSPPLPGGLKGADRATGFLVGTNAAFLLASDVTFTPTSTIDCSQAVQDAITADRLKARIVYP